MTTENSRSLARETARHPFSLVRMLARADRPLIGVVPDSRSNDSPEGVITVAGTAEVVVRIRATNIVWRGVQDPKTGHWIGVCDALNLNAVGDTYLELQACANEAVALLMTDLFETGELEAFLRRNGWTPGGQLPHTGARVAFDVPVGWEPNARLEDLAAAAH